MFLSQHPFSLSSRLHFFVAFSFMLLILIDFSEIKAAEKYNLKDTKVSLSAKSENSNIHYFINRTNLVFLIYILSGATLIYLLIQKQLKYAAPENRDKVYPDLSHFYHVGSDSITNSLQKNELIAEVNSKNKELATVTLHLVERGKLLSKIREELVTALKNTPSLTSSNELRIILRMLSDAERHRHDWAQFSIHFDEVHRNFLSALKSRYPALSTTDLKLCAYLRLNLSSKEIAQSMNITLKGVEVSRYRLRKKLNISKDVNLFDYLLQVTKSKIPKQPGSNICNVQLQEDDLAKFLSFFNKSMTAKFISQGGYDLSGEGIVFKRPVTHNKG